MQPNSQTVVLITGIVLLSVCYCYTVHAISKHDNASVKCSCNGFNGEVVLS